MHVLPQSLFCGQNVSDLCAETPTKIEHKLHSRGRAWLLWPTSGFFEKPTAVQGDIG